MIHTKDISRIFVEIIQFDLKQLENHDLVDNWGYVICQVVKKMNLNFIKQVIYKYESFFELISKWADGTD